MTRTRTLLGVLVITWAGCTAPDSHRPGGASPKSTPSAEPEAVEGSGDPGDAPSTRPPEDDPPASDTPSPTADTGSPAADTGSPAADTGDTGASEPGPTGPQSNLQVRIGQEWAGICCIGGVPVVTSEPCSWSEHERVLTDESSDTKLDCPEDEVTGCACDQEGEPLHGFYGWEVAASLDAPDGGPVYPDEELATCVVVVDGALSTAWTDDEQCPSFRLQR